MRENMIIKSIGMLSYRIDSSRYIGKRKGYGNLIRIENNIVIVTAAHCVYEIGIDRFNTNITFSTIYGHLNDCIPIETAIIHKNWGVNHKIESDTAFLIPKKKSFDITRYYKIASSIKVNSQFNDEEIMIAFMKGIVNKRIECINSLGNKGQVYGNKMIGISFKGGQGLSGSPWFYHENGEWKQVTLTSSMLRSQRNMLWGPEWGKDVIEILRYIQDKEMDDQNLMIQKIKQERRYST